MTRAPEPGERAEVDAGEVVPSAEVVAGEPTPVDDVPAPDLDPLVRPHEVPSDEAAWERAARAAARQDDVVGGGAPEDEVAPPTRLVPRVTPGATTPAAHEPTRVQGAVADDATDDPRAPTGADAPDDVPAQPPSVEEPARERDDVPDGPPPTVRRAVLPPGVDPWEASAPGADRSWEPRATEDDPAGADRPAGPVDGEPGDAGDDDGYLVGAGTPPEHGDGGRDDDETGTEETDAALPDAALPDDEMPDADTPAPTPPGVDGGPPSGLGEHAAEGPEPAPPSSAPVAVRPAPEPTPLHDAAPAGAPAPEAWRTLGRSLRPRANRAQVLAGLLCGMLGFAVVVQVRQTHDEGLSTLRQSELVGILDQTTRQGDELEREADSLERTRQKLLSGSTSSQAALDAAMSSAATQGILAGRLPAEGPGLSITVADPDGVVAARSLLNLLEELRNAGAEAVQLNDLRITASSYVVEGEGRGVVVDGVPVEPPYRWLVIGDPATMANAMEIPGGAFATIRNDGGRPTVVQQDELSVLATRTVPEPRFATPVAPEEG